jgi:hypothetical protein
MHQRFIADFLKVFFCVCVLTHILKCGFNIVLLKSQNKNKNEVTITLKSKSKKTNAPFKTFPLVFFWNLKNFHLVKCEVSAKNFKCAMSSSRPVQVQRGEVAGKM